MNRSHTLTRRSFLSAAGTASLAVAAAFETPALAQSATPPKPRIKVGCTSWAFHSFQAGENPEPAIDIIGQLGFEGIELIVLGRDDLKAYWTQATIDRIRKQLDRYKMVVSQFVLFQPVVEGLTSLDTGERNRNLDSFETGCKLARQFAAPIVNIVAPWARQLGRNQGYLPRFYELPDPAPGQKFHINIDPDFDYDAVWRNYVEVTRACLQRAKAHGRKFTIEHHTHTMVPDASTFLRLWDAVSDPDLGYNMDVGWTLLQREYPPVAVHRVKRQLMNLHARDMDGLMRQFVHIGEGVLDLQAVAQALKQIGYTGFISIEQDKFPGDMAATCRRYLAMMKEYLA